MDQSEYERRRQRLEVELEAGLEMVRAGYWAQMRALDLVWMASPDNRGALARVLEAPHPSRQLALSSAPAEPASTPASPPERLRRPAWELYHRVEEALERLPETFDRSDLVAALDPKPKTSTLHRVLQIMVSQEVIEKVDTGIGGYPSRYRKVEYEEDEANESEGVADA